MRSADELNGMAAILFHAPHEQVEHLVDLLEAAAIDWTGKALVFCDSAVPRAVRERFETRGASVAAARDSGVPGAIVIEAGKGRGSALQIALRISRQLHLNAIEIHPASADAFDAVVTLGGGAFTALIDQAVELLRGAGLRDNEATRIAASLFEQTARNYAHSGKQSWVWYIRKPSSARLRSQLTAAGPELEPVLRHLLLFAFETFGKHDAAAADLAAAFPAAIEK